MLESSFTLTAIAIGVAVWMWRQRCRLYGRNLALGLANAELRRHAAEAELQRDSLMLLARTMGGIIKQMGEDIDMLLEPEWETSQQSGEVN